MISERLMVSSSSFMRPSMKPWRSLAAWYSAFSERSPCARASSMSRTFCGRSTDLIFLSSSFKRVTPLKVMGMRPAAGAAMGFSSSSSARPERSPGAGSTAIKLADDTPAAFGPPLIPHAA